MESSETEPPTELPKFRAAPRWDSLVEAIPDFVVGITFLVAALLPGEAGDAVVTAAPAIYLLEFLVIWCSGFWMAMSSGRPTGIGMVIRRLVAVVLVAGFASIFVAAFSTHFGWWMMWSFLGLCGRKLPAILIGTRTREEDVSRAIELVETVVLYLACSFLGGFSFISCFLYFSGAGLTHLYPNWGMVLLSVFIQDSPRGKRYRRRVAEVWAESNIERYLEDRLNTRILDYSGTNTATVLKEKGERHIGEGRPEKARRTLMKALSYARDEQRADIENLLSNLYTQD